MLKIALTGGIGSGKSTVAKYFKRLGAAVIDADEIVHDLLRKPKIIRRIVNYFGSGVLVNRQLDRKILRHLVFTNVKKRHWLEKLLHPLVYKKIQLCPKTRLPYIILVIPLLLETRKTTKFDRVLVIDSTEKNRIKRLRQRDHSSIRSIKNIMRTQVARRQRLAAADYLITNNGSLRNLEQQVKVLHCLFKRD